MSWLAPSKIILTGYWSCPATPETSIERAHARVVRVSAGVGNRVASCELSATRGKRLAQCATSVRSFATRAADLCFCNVGVDNAAFDELTSLDGIHARLRQQDLCKKPRRRTDGA